MPNQLDSDLLGEIWTLLHEHLAAVSKMMADENKFLRTELENLRQDLIRESDAIIQGVAAVDYDVDGRTKRDLRN
jgi:hypothetical protein